MKLKYFPGLMMMATSLLASSLIITSCSDDDNYSVSTTPIVTSITTGDAAVTAVSAAIDGTVDDLSSADPSSYEVGVMYSTADDPTAGGTKVRGSLSPTPSEPVSVVSTPALPTTMPPMSACRTRYINMVR